MIVFFLLLFAYQITAQDLEISNYPTVPGAEKPTSVKTPLPTFLKYIYNLSLLLSGLLCFVLAIWGGVQYLTSASRPGKMADAKEQITMAFVGMAIVFGSYIIINTINPELTKLTISLFDTSSDSGTATPIEPNIGEISLSEVPVGTLITSEFLASSFLNSESTDIDYTSTSWPASSTPISTYPTDFQGALYGARLKRIHEVASTTLPVVDMLAVLSEDLKYLTGKLNEKDNELVVLASACNCAVCICFALPIPGTCETTPCPKCNGDPCPSRIRMNELREDVIPYFYTEEDDPIPCKILEIEYLSGAFESFLDDTSQLVKNKDHEGQSYWYSNEAKNLRKKIEDCIGAGSKDWINAELTQKDYTKIENQYDEIEKLIDLMADVENKGTYTPETDPPERDVEENILELEILLTTMGNVKRILNPYDQDMGHLTLISFAEAVSLETEINVLSDIENLSVPFIQEGSEDVDVKRDPATFYVNRTVPFPYYSPPESESEPRFMNTDTNTEPDLLPMKKNIAWAAETIAQIPDDPIIFDWDSSTDITRGVCDHIVEIPIGRAFDEAIKLTQDILRELKNIWDQGHLMVDYLKEQKKSAKEMFNFSDTLIDLTSESNCINRCQDVPCEPICLSYPVPTPPFGIPIIWWRSCSPPCFGPHPCSTLAQIISTGAQIQTNALNIETLYQQILNAEESMFESFFKLNSEYPKKVLHLGKWITHPEAGKRAPIGEDICCTNNKGICRDENGNLVDTEKRDYTLKEKLVIIQKLLNMSRELIDPQGEVSVYEQLLEELINLRLVDRDELRYSQKTNAAEKMDLQNCHIIYETIEETEREEPTKELLNCRNAEMSSAIDHNDIELCSSDPYLDCDFFNPPSKRTKRPIPCYCYDQGTDQSIYNQTDFPELYHYQNNFFLGFGNNYFCCIREYEE